MTHIITTQGRMIIGGKAPKTKPKKEKGKTRTLDMTKDWSKGIIYKEK